MQCPLIHCDWEFPTWLLSVSNSLSSVICLYLSFPLVPQHWFQPFWLAMWFGNGEGVRGCSESPGFPLLLHPKKHHFDLFLCVRVPCWSHISIFPLKT
jgi:hypothetical protein